MSTEAAYEDLIGLLQDFFRKLNGTPDDPALFRAWQLGMLSGNTSVPAPDCFVDKSVLSTILSRCDRLGISTGTLLDICPVAFRSVEPRFHIVSPEEAAVALAAGGVPDGLLPRLAERYRKTYRIKFPEESME